MIDKNKLTKFIQRLEFLVEQLDNKKDLTIHKEINQSYYMQKGVELRNLIESFEEAQMKLEKIGTWINEDCTVIFLQWSKDVRWLNAYQQRHRTGPVL